MTYLLIPSQQPFDEFFEYHNNNPIHCQDICDSPSTTSDVPHNTGRKYPCMQASSRQRRHGQRQGQARRTPAQKLRLAPAQHGMGQLQLFIGSAKQVKQKLSSAADAGREKAADLLAV
jgi:hypothetical protein